MAEVVLNLDKVSVALSGRVIFANLSWELQMGQKVGLVGPNGVGKSTLLRLLAQELPLEEGNLFRKSGLTWGRLAQEPQLPADKSVWDEVKMARPELVAIEQKLNNLETQMGDPAIYENSPALDKVLLAHERLLADYDRLNGPRYEASLKQALQQVGLEEEVWSRPVQVLSGGQKKLVCLAKLIVQHPQLLLLDEPDNHLDLPAKRRLESLINSYTGCVVIISHDRYLLDEVASHIAELESNKITLYNGNYSSYSTEREIRRLRQQQLYAAQQKEISRIEAAIARFQLWASLVIDERHIRQARHRQKMLDKMDKVEKVNENRRMSLDLAGWRGSNKVIELIGVGRQLPSGRVLWHNLNLQIWHNDRVGLVGPNGAGKSLLLRQLLDPEGVPAGEIRLGPSIQIGYYSQEHETLDYNRTLIDEIRQTAPLSQEAAVAYLNRFLYSYEQMRGPIANLSGGERSRLQLAKLVLTRPNLLLLDEPTNNLDIASIEVLEAALEEFVGTVVVISHDRYFLDKVVDRVIELEDGRLRQFNGGYTDYLAAL